MQSYIVSLVVDLAVSDETTRANCEINALDAVDAEEQAREWAVDLAVDGDWIVITHNGRSVRPIEVSGSY